MKFKSVSCISNTLVTSFKFTLLIISGNSEIEDIDKTKLEENDSIEFNFSNLINQQVMYKDKLRLD